MVMLMCMQAGKKEDGSNQCRGSNVHDNATKLVLLVWATSAGVKDSERSDVPRGVAGVMCACTA